MPSRKHGHDHEKHQHPVPGPQIDPAQLQSALAGYQGIAADLSHSRTTLQGEEALAPITNLEEPAQIALIKELAKEHTIEAANVLQALYTYAPAKETRKEARRSLLKLEALDLFPDWEPPRISILGSLSDEIFASPAPNRGDFDDEDDLEDEEDQYAPEGAFSAELAAQLSNFLPFSPLETTASSLLQAWGAGDFAAVYDHLTDESPLREGLSREQWIARREGWHRQARPRDMKIHFTKLSDTEQDRVEAGWSLVFSEVSSEPPLPEMPVATLTYPETGRRWFWSSYRIVDAQYIESMTDEGAGVLSLSEEEVARRIAELTAIAEKRLEELHEEEEEAELLSVIGEDEDDFEDEEDDEDEDEDDFEDEEDDEDDGDIFQMMGRVQEALSISTIAMHYSDALIQQATSHEPTMYDTPYNMAMATADHERAAAYASIMAEKIPAERGEALTDIAAATTLLANRYDSEGNEEQTEHFIALSEQHLREALTLDNNNPRAIIMLAQTIMARNGQLAEAEILLQRALALPELDARLETLARVSLGRLAQEHGQNTQALRYYQEAAVLSPDFPGIWSMIGLLQVEMGQFDEAEQSLLRSIEQDPETIDAYLELAAIYADKREDPERAESIIQLGIEANPDSADLLVAQAMLFLHRGELGLAEESLAQAEEIDPDVELLQETRQLIADIKRSQRQPRPPKHKHPRNKRKR